MTDEDRYRRARARAKEKYAFYVHLAIYASIMVMLVVINLTTSSGYFWAFWPIFGWGIAVALHAFTVFVVGRDNPILDQLTEQELRRSGGE